MKSLFKLVAIFVLIGVLSGCRKTEEVAKDSPDATPEAAVKAPKKADANIVYNGVTIGENTMPEGAREKADRISAEAAKLTAKETTE